MEMIPVRRDGQESSDSGTNKSGSDAKYWTGIFGDLRTPALSTVPICFCFIGYYLKTIDWGKCNGDGGISENSLFLFYCIWSILFMCISSLIVVPCMVCYIRGLTEEGLDDNKWKLKLSYSIVNLFIMAGVVLMGLSTSAVVQARFGCWACLSLELKILMVFVRFSLCLIDFLLIRNLYVVWRYM